MPDAHPSPGDLILWVASWESPAALQFGVVLGPAPADGRPGGMPSSPAVVVWDGVGKLSPADSSVRYALLADIVGLINANHTDESAISGFVG